MKKLNELQSCLTRLRGLMLTLIILCSIGSGNVWGADATVQLQSNLGLSSGSTFSSTTQNSVTLSGAKGGNSNPPKYYTSGDAVRFYAKNTMTIAHTSGMTKIVVNYGSKSNAISSASVGSIGSYSSSKQTWTGDATSVTFTFGGTSGNDQITSVVVTPKGASYTVVWTINPAAGGSLSATSGTSTTVTPNAAYTYGSPAYTVTSGSATVSQSTNTFTATPTSGCTIRINMVEKPKYTITYNAGSGSCGTSTWTQGSYGASTTLPAATTSCTGWSFAGWCTSSAGSADENSSSPGTILTGSYTPTSNVTLYAVYTRSVSGGGTSYVSVDASGVTEGTYVIAALKSSSASSNYYPATGSVSSGDMTVGSTAFTLTAGAFSEIPTGGIEFTFTGNNTDGFSINNGSGNLYFTTSSNRKLAFQANNTTKWKVYNHDNPLNTNGVYLQYYDGSSSYYTITENSTGDGAIRGYANNTKYRAIYLFKKTGGSTTYYMTNMTCGDPCEKLGAATGLTVVTNFVQDGQTYVKFSWTPADNTKANAASQKLCFGKVGEEGKCVDDLEKNLTWTGDLASELPAGEYWWSIQALGDGNNYCNGDVVNGTNFYIYSITYNTNGGNTIAATSGTTLPDPLPTPTREHYNFEGWYTNSELTIAATAGAAITQNTTLYAKWSHVVYTVTYNNGAGTGLGSTNTAGSFDLPSATPPITCDAEGWTFAGWTTESVSETTTTPDPLYAAGSSYTPTSDITLYAVYQRTEGGGGGGEASLTKMVEGNTLSDGDKIVVVANETSTAMYQETINSSYVNKWDCSTLTADVVAGDDKKWWTVEMTTGGFYLGDATNGYLNMSSNNLYCNENKSVWTLLDLEDGTFKLQSNGRNLSYRSDLNPNSYWRMGGASYGTSGQTILNLYKYTSGGSSTTTTYNSNPKCCTQPKTPLTITADQIELVKSGVVTLTATGGNGTDITWTATGGVLSNQSNTGATLTISDVDATQNITVTATQAENNNDDEIVYCAQEASIDITVKAQWTITFQTNDNGVKNSNSILVTDGESYTMPDISDEYVCNSGSSFAGWVDNEADTEVDATPNSTQTATADQTWYAAWSSSSNTKSVDIYQLVTNVTNLAAGDEVWITNTTPTVAMGVQNDNNRGQVTVTKHPTESDKIYSTGSPATLTIGKDGTNYTFHDGTGYLYAASSSKNYLRRQATNNANGKWSITIEDGKATITAQGTNTRNKLKYNSSSSIFSCYESGQGDVRIYKNVGTAEIEVSGASITTNNTSCHRGAVIFAENGKWITSSKGQKVRIAINVTARGFESDATLSATSANEHFSVVSITNTTITKNSAFETQMMIEYQPAEANTNENAEITLVAKKGEEVVATRTIDVNGRSLPDEFVIVAQYNDKWLAVPANMQSGADQYNGIEVTPNNELTQIPAAPSTTIYSLRGVADNRYEAAGTCVRLVGNGNKCLWGNAASTNTSIQNWTTLGATNGSNYEWLLTTSDGELYTIANPEHPDYDEGRILSNSGSKYGLYKGTTKFYILPVGCSSLPGNIQVTARRVDATFSWETNASTVTIDLYTNEGMTEGHKTASVTDVPYLFSSLAENTQYWYKLTPDADDDCAVTGTFKTTGPVIDVVEWGENSATIYVDKDEAVDPRIIIAGEVEHGQGGIVATDIFFSKYFEAEGTAKLLAIYNGTANAISLADITILQRTSAKNTPLSLASYGKTAGWIQPGEEIVLFNRDSRDAVMECAENNETYDSWINVENNNLSFSGKGTIRLFRGNTCIDIIGAMNAGDNAANMNDKTRDPMEGAASPSFGDDKGFVTLFGDNYKTPAEETDYELSTNRCLLIRRAFVTSGDSALLNNFGDFKTLGTYTGVDSKTHKGEWSGLRIPTAVPPETDYIHTCAGFEDAGSFDYNKYYKEFSTISDDKYLSDFTRADDGTYTLSIEYMRQYACMNLKFQLTAHNDPTDVLTEQLVQVPIVVKDDRNSNDTLFNNIIKQDVEPHAPMVPESINRCKTCNVVVLGTGTLTKVADGSTNDVAEIRDVKVYPGGKLIIPEGTHYVVNSLALRRQEDVVAAAKINSGLADDPDDITDKGIYIRESNGVYLDVRIDPSKWHYFTLPYDCRVGDVRFADGTPAKVNTDYLISWYDGAYRAEHKTGGWTDITSDDYVLKAGLGYIVALPGSGLIKRELRFPMANNVIAEELGDKTVGGLYAYGGDKTDEELRPNHKGWNMIGNPYLYDYTTNIITYPLAVGELEHDPSGSSWNGKWVRTGSARYIVAPIDDNGWKGYEQTTISNLRPFMSYFIQVGTKTDGTEKPETERSITFDKDQKPASIIRRAQAEDAEPMYPVWYGLELLAPNGEKDNTTLLISNEFTDDYDMMDDLIKMRGSYYNYYQNPVLASRNNSGEMAFNALPDSSAAVIGVPLNYYAYQAGTYTFATDSRYDLEEVKSAMLFDATTQQYYDLLTENHSFSLAKGDNNARFKLYVRVERKKPQITTDVDNLLVDGQLSLIALDKTLVLSGLTDAADIYVYDATGKLIRSDLSASGGGIWRTNVPAQGVYFVRVNSTTSQQTLRTVVK